MSSGVAVIGGGLIGASIAFRLAQAGAAVEVLEAGEWGREASWAGAGMLSPGGEVEHDGPSAQLALEGRALYPAFCAELTALTGLAIDLRLCGAVELALSEAEAAALQARMAAQTRFGIESHWLSAADAAAFVPAAAPTPHGAAHYHGDAIVDPRQLMAALRIACTQLGVVIHEHTPIAAIEPHATHTGLRTAAGAHHAAETAVLAAGAWSSHIACSINCPLQPPLVASFPVRGHLASYDLAPSLLHPILRHGHTYLLQRTNGTLITGTTTEHAGFDRTLDPAHLDDIRRRATALLPALAAAAPTAAWNGFRPGAAQDHPVLTRIPGTRLFTAYGHYRNGILMAPATAARLTAMITSSWGTA